jgi:hypothetical protein
VWPIRVNGFGFLTVPDNDIISLKAREKSREFEDIAPGATKTIAVGSLVFVISGPLQGRQSIVTARQTRNYRVDVGTLNVTISGENLTTEKPPP